MPTTSDNRNTPEDILKDGPEFFSWYIKSLRRLKDFKDSGAAWIPSKVYVKGLYFALHVEDENLTERKGCYRVNLVTDDLETKKKSIARAMLKSIKINAEKDLARLISVSKSKKKLVLSDISKDTSINATKLLNQTIGKWHKEVMEAMRDL